MSLKQFKVVTFNSWLLPFFSKDLKARAEEFVDHIVTIDADIFAFQEIWSEKLRRKFAKQFAEKGYRFSAFNQAKWNIFLRGILGNGLMIVSRYPLKLHHDQLYFDKYTAPEEYFASKGCLHATVELPGFGEIDFFNAHLGAVRWNRRLRNFFSNDENNRFRQIEQLARHVLKSSRHRVRILAGDFNFHPLLFDAMRRLFVPGTMSRDFLHLTSFLSLKSTFHWHHGHNAGADTVDYQNSYLKEGYFSGIPSQHIDYIFVNSEQEYLTPIGSRRVLDDAKVGTTGRCLSDHYGVETTFQILRV